MAKPKHMVNKGASGKGNSSSKRKQKKSGAPAQKPAMQRILVLRNNKRVLEWRPWGV